MTAIKETIDRLLTEITFSTGRSSGPGGQHVNKVNTFVELRFNINSSDILDDHEKSLLYNALSSYISKDGILILGSQRERSQYLNKKEVVCRFQRLISQALRPQKERKTTTPTKVSDQKRLKNKRMLAEKKARRKMTEE